MRVLIAGASGFVGSALTKSLCHAGYTVLRLVRDPAKVAADTLYWNPAKNELDTKKLEELKIDAVVNLAGESVVGGRWTEERKKRILQSRVAATTLLAKSIASMKVPPQVFISASAVGFYGDRGEQACTENTPPGNGFLGDVSRQWESATAAAEAAGVRTIHLRIGIVLSPEGGALSKMLLPFKLCLGGRLGSGKQYMSWIALEDLTSIILFLLTHEEITGAINAVAPYAATNAQFTEALGRALHRPTIFPVPASVLRALCGREMADEFFLSSVRVLPRKLIETGYNFRHSHVEEALKNMLE